MFLMRSSVLWQELTPMPIWEATGVLCFENSGPSVCASLALLVFSTCVTVKETLSPREKTGGFLEAKRQGWDSGCKVMGTIRKRGLLKLCTSHTVDKYYVQSVNFWCNFFFRCNSHCKVDLIQKSSPFKNHWKLTDLVKFFKISIEIH